VTDSADSDERRCPDCHQLMYLDGRPGGTWKHYLNDMDRCPSKPAGQYPVHD